MDIMVINHDQTLSTISNHPAVALNMLEELSSKSSFHQHVQHLLRMCLHGLAKSSFIVMVNDAW